MSFLFRRRADNISKTVSLKADDTAFPITYQLAAVQGIGKRSEQQDSYACVNENDVIKIKREGLFAVVADGMGGLASGKQVSELVIDCMLHSFETIDLTKDICVQLKKAAVEANDRTFQEYNCRGGSTLIACLLYGGKLWYVSVGDSALFLLRAGCLSQINSEQNSLTDGYRRLVRSCVLEPALVRDNPEKAALSHYIGMKDLDEIDAFLQPLPMEDGDTLLICSDGISSFLSEEQIRLCMSSGSPRDVCSQLESGIFKRAARNQDNYTAIVIRCMR